jgi:hypothetical protein
VRSAAGRLYPHFYAGKETLVDFLDNAAGSSLRGTYLEIISPYFDDASECEPLKELIERFRPREVRVFLPRGSAGEALCGQTFFESIQALRGVSWGHLSGDWLRFGRSEDAGARFVHAKVYRFFTQKPKREICFVGSAGRRGLAAIRQKAFPAATTALFDRTCWLISGQVVYNHGNETRESRN